MYPKTTITLALLLAAPLLHAGSKGRLLFQDDFNRSESQELKDEPGNGWTTSSDARAHGNKQVDLRDGAMYIYMHATGDHAVSVRHEFEPLKDGSIQLRFMLENQDDSLGLNIVDMNCKEVHAGHLAMARVFADKVTLTDSKTGAMDLKIRNARKEGPLSPETQALLKTKDKAFKNTVETGKWHTLALTFSGQTMSLAIDGKEIGAHTSEGYAHPTKTMLRLSVPKQAVVDDLKIHAAQ